MITHSIKILSSNVPQRVFIFPLRPPTATIFCPLFKTTSDSTKFVVTYVFVPFGAFISKQYLLLLNTFLSVEREVAVKPLSCIMMPLNLAKSNGEPFLRCCFMRSANSSPKA